MPSEAIGLISASTLNGLSPLKIQALGVNFFNNLSDATKAKLSPIFYSHLSNTIKNGLTQSVRDNMMSSSVSLTMMPQSGSIRLSVYLADNISLSPSSTVRVYVGGQLASASVSASSRSVYIDLSPQNAWGWLGQQVMVRVHNSAGAQIGGDSRSILATLDNIDGIKEQYIYSLGYDAPLIHSVWRRQMSDINFMFTKEQFQSLSNDGLRTYLNRWITIQSGVPSYTRIPSEVLRRLAATANSEWTRWVDFYTSGIPGYDRKIITRCFDFTNLNKHDETIDRVVNPINGLATEIRVKDQISAMIRHIGSKYFGEFNQANPNNRYLFNESTSYTPPGGFTQFQAIVKDMEYEFFNTWKVNAIGIAPALLNAMRPSQFVNLCNQMATDLQGNPALFNKLLNAAALNGLPTNYLLAMPPDAIRLISADALNGLSTAMKVNLDANFLNNLSPEAVSGFDVSNITNLNVITHLAVIWRDKFIQVESVLADTRYAIDGVDIEIAIHFGIDIDVIGDTTGFSLVLNNGGVASYDRKTDTRLYFKYSVGIDDAETNSLRVVSVNVDPQVRIQNDAGLSVNLNQYIGSGWISTPLMAPMYLSGGALYDVSIIYNADKLSDLLNNLTMFQLANIESATLQSMLSNANTYKLSSYLINNL
jgi:hypothetical protein